MSFKVTFATKWSDFDPNRHLRHTAYNEYAAEVRIRYFSAQNFSIQEFTKHNVGPILFTEETSFRKEIHLGENIRVTMKLAGVSRNNERWKLRHEVFNEAGELSAVIKVYGAWMDLTKRKLTALPEQAKHLFLNAEKTSDFEEIPISSKS
ncbi:MAG: thioesterase family protein [Polaribacter sp.]|jgi:acyl-CoA thioester hydrolase